MILNYKKTVGTSLASLFALSLLATPAAQAASYKPCAAIAQELGIKIARLNRLAAERRTQGDAYGERRLKSLANVVGAHRGNLPCVGKRSCAL
ncbi:hypothetical protein [Thiothrix eikelboomii]|uniref:Uncharacterized protein n=1 Tax=Thiothrix eikelboomii TaxID=92487 RepID=A0A1T4VYI7_9GAMM|nr:hypothetical protein [Thiothrix eikelboomii]SKA69875.1 hypothetical protein SAMN02745130_00612 [Thiothrix eikelboomii]